MPICIQNPKENASMIEIAIPGYRDLQLAHLVLDYNGTIAFDGNLIPGVSEALKQMAGRVMIHVLTADTFGSVRKRLEGLPCRLFVLGSGPQDREKCDYVESLGAVHTVSVGNGRNDRLMLAASVLGIAVIQGEGAAAATLAAADVVCPDILSALELLMNPLRLTATLRS